MANQLSLPLKIAKDIEPEKTWENITTPADMIALCAKLLSVDISQFESGQGVISSPIEPTGTDRRNIWIKTEGMPAIGILIGGRYELIYKYPPGTAFLWTTAGSIPSYLRELTDSELANASITKPSESARYRWVINDEV